MDRPLLDLRKDGRDMKDFFTKWGERYTEEARQFLQECGLGKVRDAIRKWSAEGYSIREMQLLLQMEIMDICLMEVLELGTREVPRGTMSMPKKTDR